MEDTSQPKDANSRNGLPIIGLLLCIIPLKLAALRFFSIHMFSQNSGVPFRGIVRWFDSHFANFEQDPIITSIVLVLAIGSVVTSVMGYSPANKTFKLLSVFLIGISSVIIVLQLLMMFLSKTA